jgi:hypothetical protein
MCSFTRFNHTIKMGVTKDTVKPGELQRHFHYNKLCTLLFRTNTYLTCSSTTLVQSHAVIRAVSGARCPDTAQHATAQRHVIVQHATAQLQFNAMSVMWLVKWLQDVPAQHQREASAMHLQHSMQQWH